MSEVRTTSSTGGQKGVKPERYDLVPVEAEELIARVYAMGAEKYADHNWRKGYEWSKSYAAMQRHVKAFWRGEDLDPESGLPHLAHAAFHINSLLVFMAEHPEFDDRPRVQAKPVVVPRELVDDVPGSIKAHLLGELNRSYNPTQPCAAPECGICKRGNE